jgi:ubiquinone/menaquinone biosynthesis C-methylase UbiE
MPSIMQAVSETKSETDRQVSMAGRARYFARKFVAHGRIRLVLQYLFAKFQALLIQPTILPYFVTFFPYKRSAYSYKVLKRPPRSDAGKSELPMPPESLWMGYGMTANEWLDSGKEHVATMRRVLADSGFTFDKGSRILELGCAAGRMLRCLSDVADQCEIWGTDIDGEHVFWCKQNLSPPFHFFLTTTYPHLPFEDGYFDVVYAGSVFTHIDDLADAWFLELRRILKPNGRLYITIHDNHTIRMLDGGTRNLSRTLYSRKDLFENDDYSMFTIGRFMRSQVFYDKDSLIRTLEPFFDTVSVTNCAYGFQTAMLLQKR